MDYQYRSSTDNSLFGEWADLADAFASTNFSFVHDSLYSDVYYEYRCRYRYTNGTITEYGDFYTPGNGDIQSGNTGYDALAASIGTITSGFLRGVVFETSPNNPKVRMDPSGFYAIGTSSTPVIISADPATPVQLEAHIRAKGVDFTSNSPGSSFKPNQSINWYDSTASATPMLTLGGWSSGGGAYSNYDYAQLELRSHVSTPVSANILMYTQGGDASLENWDYKQERIQASSFPYWLGWIKQLCRRTRFSRRDTFVWCHRFCKL